MTTSKRRPRRSRFAARTACRRVAGRALRQSCIVLKRDALCRGPPLRSRASRAPQGYQIASRQPWEILGEAVDPAAWLSNLRSLRRASAPLPSSCELPQLPARVQAHRAFGAASGAPWESLGNLTVRYRLLAAREPRPTHDEVKQKRGGFSAIFEATPCTINLPQGGVAWDRPTHCRRPEPASGRLRHQPLRKVRQPSQ
jgi:hypothetical protein